MRRSSLLLLGILGLGCPGLWAGGAESQPPVVEPVLAGLEDVPPVVARVDGHPITRRELVRELVGSGAAEALDRIVRRMLVDQAAKEAGITVSKEELGNQLELDKRALPNELAVAPWDVDKLGAIDFAAVVRARYGMTLEQYKGQILRQRLLLGRLLGKNLHPIEATLRKFFRDQEERFQPPARYRAAHILVTPLSPQDLYRSTSLKSRAAQQAELAGERKRMEAWRKAHGIEMKNAPPVALGREWAWAQKRALQCWRELKNGTLSWEQAVRKYSQDPREQPGRGGLSFRERLNQRRKKKHRPPLQPGEIGEYTKQGPMVQAFYEGTKDLKVGGISPPIRTRFGYHVVKMLNIVRQPRKRYEEVRDQVYRAYREFAIAAKSGDWMRQKLETVRLEGTRALLWPPDPTRDEEEDRDPVVGTVNGEPLRRSAVWLELLRSGGKEALQRLINREIALGPLARLGPERMEWLGLPRRLRSRMPPPILPIRVSGEEIDRELTGARLELDRRNEERRRLDPKASPRHLEPFIFERYGQSLPQYRRALRAGLVLSQAIKRNARVDKPTLLQEWALAKERYTSPVLFEVRHILIPLPPHANPGQVREARRMARLVRQQLLDDPSRWEELSKTFNEAEKEQEFLGWLHPKTTIYPEIYRALAAGNWKKGQIPPPIRTRKGFHVVRVERRRSPRVPDFEEVRKRVERDYLAARGAIFLNVWLRSLERQARIERYLFKVEPLIPQDVLQRELEGLKKKKEKPEKKPRR